MKKTTSAILASAVTGLFLGAATGCSKEEPQTPPANNPATHSPPASGAPAPAAPAKHACKGQNACKGQGGCKVG